ncbi:MAG: protein-glutamine glutaminase family protein [Pseudomonadota bacterium]
MAMKTALLLFFLIFISSLSYAKDTVSVHELISPVGGDQDYLLLTSDGRVYRLSTANQNLVAQVPRLLPGQMIEIEGRGERTGNQVKSITVLPTRAPLVVKKLKDEEETPPEFTPTDVGTLDQVANYFNGLFRNFGRKQCYQRAHVWAHGLWTDYQIKSQKILILYTRAYIRHFAWGWWFHIAPYLMAQNQEWVIDATFTEKPVTTEDWAKQFGKIPCQVINNYQTFEEKTNEVVCLLRKVPMYYYQPLNIREMDLEHEYQSDWDPWSLRHMHR